MENTIEYQGTKYATRTFEAYLSDETPEDVQTLTIATTVLSNALGDEILDEGSEEERIDSGIYYYVEPEHFGYDAETLCLECLDEPYILIEEIF